MSQCVIFNAADPMLPHQETTRRACAVDAMMLGGHSLGQKEKPNILHPYLQSLCSLGVTEKARARHSLGKRKKELL